MAASPDNDVRILLCTLQALEFSLQFGEALLTCNMFEGKGLPEKVQLMLGQRDVAVLTAFLKQSSREMPLGEVARVASPDSSSVTMAGSSNDSASMTS